ncbi:hypothetical protein J421_1472 [Gemmatirosa kalamazoonensis]|jgi:hypothetical protein|uniref:Uncharacterized protein n=1 Tax=Gemmatirosa kalamazoonensis TaxID=861299 RepID=W0RD03_9BACT|nr:hypothetical protein [Gemmatirosa kalamazoonensis]AHG89009.1 hypothetical protein J421_1472 [Gemmatirosa kalamazoonensis]
MPHRRPTVHPVTPPIETVRALIAERTPRADAVARVQVSAPHARSAYLAYTRIAGPRDDVLDYTAYLFATDTNTGAARLDLDAVERDADGELTLLLSRSLYSEP